MSEINVYTDASLRIVNKKGHFRIGIFVIDPRDKEYRFSRKIERSHFKSIWNYDNFHSNAIEVIELLAIYTALNILNKINIKINIYTDSDICFDTIYNMREMKKENKMFHIILKDVKEILSKMNVEIRCINSHNGIYGNEHADFLARKSKNNNHLINRLRNI
jgi:ribonuclease HI